MHGTLLQPDSNPFEGRTRLESALYLLSVYLAPALIGLATLLALTAWSGHYPAGKGDTLMFRVAPELPGAKDAADPAAALARLNGQPLLDRFHTRLAETPFWIVFSTVPAAQQAPVMLEFPSRHTQDLRCWDARSLTPLGSGSRAGTDGGVTRIKAGFALTPALSTEVLCRMRFIGPAALSVLQWPADRLQLSAYEFHRNAGLLDGGLLVLAAFVLITALILRSGTYVLFAAWLVINLRMAALSGGWDIQWL
ncbi:MAG: diguanylate cyclase, partial [Burkholderiaceae bacterium]